MASTRIRKTVLKNGLRVITKRIPGSKRFRISIGAGVGSAHDPIDKDGMHHLFEHMAFKGTKTRNSEELRALLNRYCYYSNAYTERLETVYQLEGVRRHVRTITELALDIYCNSVFLDTELAKEKEVVHNEIARDNDQDEYAAMFGLWNLLWEKNPLRKFGVGTVEGVNAVTRDDLLRVHGQRYLSDNTFIVATGAVDHEELVAMARQAVPFAEVKQIPSQWDDEWKVLPRQKEIVIERPIAQKGCIIYGIKIPNRNSMSEREGLILFILQDMLDALLTLKIRDEKGFAYTVGASIDGDYGLGHYLIFSGECLPQRINDVKRMIPEIAYSFPLNEKNFRYTREGLDDKLLIALESTTQWDKFIIDHGVKRNKPAAYMNDAVRTRQKLLKDIRFEEILEMRKRLIDPERMACSIVKPK